MWTPLLIATAILAALWWGKAIFSGIFSTGQRWVENFMRRMMFQSACGDARSDPRNGLRLYDLADDDVSQAIDCLQKLLEVPEMKSVHLHWSELSRDAFMQIWKEAQHLQTWFFQGCKLGVDESTPELACNLALQPLRHGKVHELHAVQCHVTAAQLHQVAQDFGRPKMTAIEMTQTVKDMKADMSLAWNLQLLNLAMNQLTGGGRSLGTLLRSLPMLQVLALIGCELTLEDIEQIAKALPRSSLYYLDLAQNNLGSQALMALARALPNSKLQSLGLERNEIAPGEALNELKLAHDKRPFPHLRLKKNHLTADELKAFEDSLKKVNREFCPPGCGCFEGRGEVM